MSACTKQEGTRELTVSISVVRALVESVEDAGVARLPFLRAAGLDAGRLEQVEARISAYEMYKLCELALELTRDPAFGLHWAERLHGSALGPLWHLIAHSGTLRQGLASLDRFYQLLSDASCHELVEQEDTVTVRCGRLLGSEQMQRFSAEIIMAFFFRLLRDFDRHARPRAVCFRYSAPAYRSEYAGAFEQLERFDQPFTGIVFDRALLDCPAPHKDDDVHDALEALAERRLGRLAHRTPYVLRVREELLRQGLPLRSDMATVARALGMSARSLRRRLVAEGQSYNAVVNEALAILAKRLLREEKRSIQETAYEMGFSDPRTFYRAFKRWTGTTPSAYLSTLR